MRCQKTGLTPIWLAQFLHTSLGFSREEETAARTGARTGATLLGKTFDLGRTSIKAAGPEVVGRKVCQSVEIHLYHL